jgi:hypothetical protein
MYYCNLIFLHVMSLTVWAIIASVWVPSYRVEYVEAICYLSEQEVS